jgi:large subunit ribosomal protein L18
MKMTRNNKRLHRARRVRSKLSGTTVRPRLNIFRSLTTFSAQLIDDEKDHTLFSVSLKDVKNAKNTVEGAGKLGTFFAKKAQEAEITEVVFDRAGYKYHGKVKAFAEAARHAGLKF